MLLVLALFVLVFRLHPSKFRIGRRRSQRQFVPGRGFQSKPAWVPEEIIRLKTLMPEAGCRLIAANFNRCLGPTRCETVSKSYVADLLRRRAYEVQVLRRRIKKPPPPGSAQESRLGRGSHHAQGHGRGEPARPGRHRSLKPRCPCA